MTKEQESMCDSAVAMFMDHELMVVLDVLSTLAAQSPMSVEELGTDEMRDLLVAAFRGGLAIGVRAGWQMRDIDATDPKAVVQ